MTAERLAEIIAAIDEVNAIGTGSVERCISRDIGLLGVGVSIELSQELNKGERDRARKHLLEVRGSYLDKIGGDTFEYE